MGFRPLLLLLLLSGRVLVTGKNLERDREGTEMGDNKDNGTSSGKLPSLGKGRTGGDRARRGGGLAGGPKLSLASVSGTGLDG